MSELYRVRLKWYKLKVTEPEISENVEKISSFLAFLINFEAFLFPFFSFVRLISRSSYNAFELYRVRLTGTKMKLEIAKVFDLDGVRLKRSISVCGSGQFGH